MIRSLLVAIPLLLAACQTTPIAANDAWSHVRFLAGCWQDDVENNGSREVWTLPLGDTMYGQNHVLRGGEMAFFELLAIERREQQLVYVARPGGGAPTEFVMTASGDGFVTFENPMHDFPKRIRYQLSGTDTLQATADNGTDEGKKLAFRWQRAR